MKSIIETLKNIFSKIFDAIAPRRPDFEIVKSMTEKDILKLPVAPRVQNCDWIHPLFHYKDNRVRAIIWELKFKNNTTHLDTIGRLIYEEMIDLISDIILFDGKAKFLLIPIPISAERRSERCYNQSEYLARAVLENDAERYFLYAPQWFEKIKDTSKQSWSESREKRMRNLVGCFSADPRVGEYYVILIDDVVTTGSTLSEARKTLFEAGAKNVYAFTIAH